MATPPNYTNEIQSIDAITHIRKRPGMYVGQVNIKGFTNMLKEACGQLINIGQCSTIIIDLKDSKTLKIECEQTKNEVPDFWSKFYPDENVKIHHSLAFTLLNALSNNFDVILRDEAENIITEQYFEKGRLVKGDLIKDAVKCTNMSCIISLDKSI